MAYKVLFIFYRGVMKELGEYLKETRLEKSVELEEASDDLEIDFASLENIEAGNVRAFKDVLSMKELVKIYAKYLGLDSEKIVDEFNDFLFEHTSKISLVDIRDAVKSTPNENKVKKVFSPYTKIETKKHINKKLVLNIFLIIIFIVLIIVAINEMIKPEDKKVNIELKNELIRGVIV